MKGNLSKDVMKNLLLLPKKKKINEEVLNILQESIRESEENELFWAEQLVSNPNNRLFFNIFHSSRMLRCALFGYYLKVLEARDNSKHNPTILESSTKFVNNINKMWKEFINIHQNFEKNRPIDITTLQGVTNELENIASLYINIGRKKDFEGISSQLFEEIKKVFTKITSEV